MGPTLEETRRDLRYMPTQYLTQVVQSANDRVIGDIPLKTLAGLELSRRAQMQSEMAGMNAPSPQMPTVMASTVQSLAPQPQMPQAMPQPMPQQQPPQQAAPQPQPQQPPQPQQQQQQPPQAKQPPIMGLPAMQGPKKMAGGGIIAFANQGSVPPAEEATSTVGDALRKALQWFQDVGDPTKNPREIEAREIQRAHSIKPGPLEALTPSERTKRENESAQILKNVADKQAASVASAAPAAAAPAEKPPITKGPEPDGLALLAKMMGGMGGGGGFGGPSKEDNELRRRILAGEPMGPAQTSYMQNVDRLAPQLETSKAPVLSDSEASALENRQFEKYQARSKPHFDMMQKLIDEERASNQEGKASEVYKMLGKMGGSLMSARGAFGPALGNAVSEGIDYNDKVNAARAAAERLRRSAQMDLVKARMADEKDDQKSAQAYIAEHDRKIRDAYKMDIDGKIAALNARGKLAEFEAGDERSRERNLAALAVSDAKRAADMARMAGTQENNMLRLQLGLAGLQQKTLPSVSDKVAIDKLANELFSDSLRSPEAIKYISSLKELGGENLLKSIKMGTMKPDDPKFLAVVQAAKDAYKKNYLQGTRTSGGGSGVESGADFAARIGAQ